MKKSYHSIAVPMNVAAATRLGSAVGGAAGDAAAGDASDIVVLSKVRPRLGPDGWGN
jgi:hypothetical protein